MHVKFMNCSTVKQDTSLECVNKRGYWATCLLTFGAFLPLAARQVGFLADKPRMNVAVTRARRHCCVVCDSECVKNDPFLARMVAYFEEHGEVLSPMDYEGVS